MMVESLIARSERDTLTSQANRTLRGFPDVFEAEIVRDRLAAADIRCYVKGTDMATALSLGGAATSKGVRLEVAPEDYERAIETLERDERVRQEAGGWCCGRCGEPNESSFEICWSCSKPRSEDDVRIDGHDSETRTTDQVSEGFGDLEVESPKTNLPDDQNPYRPVLVDEANDSFKSNRRVTRVTVSSESLDDQVRQVMIAATASTLLFPPLSTVYVISRLRSLPPDAYLDPRRRKRIQIAWWITMLSGIIGVGYLILFLG